MPKFQLNSYNYNHKSIWYMLDSYFVLAFYGCYKKLPQIKWLIKYLLINLQFWRTETQNGSHWAQIYPVLHSFLEVLGFRGIICFILFVLFFLFLLLVVLTLLRFWHFSIFKSRNGRWSSHNTLHHTSPSSYLFWHWLTYLLSIKTVVITLDSPG